jgi:hypothetical protein
MVTHASLGRDGRIEVETSPRVEKTLIRPHLNILAGRGDNLKIII